MFESWKPPPIPPVEGWRRKWRAEKRRRYHCLKWVPVHRLFRVVLLQATPATDEEEKEGRMGSESKYGGDSEAAAAAKSSARAKSATLGDSVACEAEVWTKYSPTLHTNDWEPEPDRL